MLRLLHQVSLRQLRASWGRTALVVSGVATGLSLIVAINIINESVVRSFRRTIELVAGPAALEVTLGIGEIGFPESMLNAVRADPDVVAAVPLVRGTVSLADDPAEAFQLFGVDLMAEEDLGRYPITTADRDSVLRGLEDPHSILLTTAFAGRQGLRVGGTVRVGTPAGIQRLTVRGLLQQRGAAKALGGQLAVMDLPAAQLLLDKTERIDQIDVVVREEASVAAVQQRLQAALPQTLTVGRPEQRGEHYERILAAFQAMLTGLSTLCLVAGVFIIYNTSATGALGRAAVMAELRLLGTDEARLFRLLMIEAAVLGALGSMLGIGLGIVLAHFLSQMVSESMGAIFQLRFPVEQLTVPLGEQGAIAALGIGTTLFASYFAARRASRVEPLAIMRGTVQASARQTGAGRLTIWWAAMVAISAVAIVMEVRQKSFAWGNFGSTLWNASVLVVAIPLLAVCAATLRRWLPRFFGVEGRVAVESVLRRRNRTGLTAAAVALVLTVGITVSTLATSFRRSVASYFESGLIPGDLVVSAVSTEGGWLETPLPESLGAQLRLVPGVKSVEMFRYLAGHTYRGERIGLLGWSDELFDPALYGRRWYQDGDPLRASQALQAGQGVNVSVGLADRFGLRLGDSIELDTPTGSLALPIVGVVNEYSSDRGTVVMNRRLLAERWGETAVSRFYVVLEPGVSAEVGRRRIVEAVGDRHRLKILSFTEAIQDLSAAIGRGFAFTDALQLMIVIVTVAGIFDLLVAAIVERRRELAVWRMIGADEGSVRRSILIESATVGGLGTVLGVAVGLVTAWIWVRFNFPYLLGFTLEYHPATAATAWYAVLAIAMTMLAGYGAAYYATGQSVLEGLQAEGGRKM